MSWRESDFLLCLLSQGVATQGSSELAKDGARRALMALGVEDGRPSAGGAAAGRQELHIMLS